MRPPTRLSAAAGGLSYRVLGKTGLKVTSVGFGCMVTSDPAVISRAVDLGINHFDTSRDYQRGNNERMVGAALGRNRKRVILSTKTDGLNAKDALAELDTSLQALQTDYVDIWYLHEKATAEDLSAELIEAMQSAKKAGKIRFTGVSTHAGHEAVFPAAIKSGKFDVILTTYNFALDQQRLDALIKSASDAGIGVVAMKVMAGSFQLKGMPPAARQKIKQPGVALSALKWALRNPHIGSIPSMVSMDQLEQNIQAMAAPFGQADEKLLLAQLEYIRPLYCRMCGECKGVCPQGLPVSDMLRILSYADGYGQFPLARERFQQLPQTVQNVRCNLCPVCSVQCPNGVRVSERLTRAQEMLA